VKNKRLPDKIEQTIDQCRSADSRSELWAACQKGADLRRRIVEARHQKDTITGASFEAVETQLAEAHESCRGRLLKKVTRNPENGTELEAKIETRISDLEELLHDVISVTDRSPFAVAHTCALAREELSWLHSLLNVYADRDPSAYYDDLSGEIKNLREQATRLTRQARTSKQDLPGDTGDLPQSMNREHLAIIRAKVDRFLRRTTGSVSEPVETSLDQLLDEHRYANALLFEGWNQLDFDAPGNGEAQELRTGLKEVKHRKRDLLNAIRNTCPPDSNAARDPLRQRCVDLDEQADEIITAFEELPLSSGIFLMEELKEDAEAFRDLLDQAEGFEDEKEVLNSARRSLRNELQERVLQNRLEARFGSTCVTLFENMILVLILGVVGLMVVEHTVAISDAWKRTFLLLDAVACSLFLLDFFTKLTLSRYKLLYFGRNVFIELVPSIPYGFLVSSLAGLDVIRSLRLFQFLRMSRLLRYFRVARPFLRAGRLFMFSLRGMDRIVEHLGPALNRNILLFSDREKPENTSDTISRCLRLERNFRKQYNNHAQSLELERRHTLLTRLLEAFRVKRRNWPDLGSLDTKLAPARNNKSRQQIDDVIQTLIHFGPGQVEDHLGPDFARRCSRLLRVMNLPLIGRFSVIHNALNGEDRDPLAVTSRAINEIGRLLQKTYSGLLWWKDLYGAVSAPRLLDSIGQTIIDSTARPAKRLLYFGSIFVLAHIVIQISGLDLLSTVTRFLSEKLGTPIIVIGLLCFIPLTAGYWIRRLAGEATEFYERVSEAQFFNLTEDIKKKHKHQDLKRIARRVVQPELALNPDPSSLLPGIDSLSSSLLNALDRAPETPSNQESTGLDDRWTTVRYLYRDYLDGGLLHPGDTKTTEQILGNLTLENIREERLNISEEKRNELENLSHYEERFLFGGPHLWHRFITTTLTQKVAKLIVNYNRHCIPKNRLDDRSDEETKRYRRWLRRRKAGREIEEDPDTDVDQQISDTYSTTEFNALHFLEPDEQRDRAVEERYGADVREILEADRRHLIREVFGTFPREHLPEEIRTFNPYRLYHRYVSGARILLLPYYLTLFLFRMTCWGLDWMQKSIRRLINPSANPFEKAPEQNDFEAARRKIHRMRKPVYLDRV